MLARQYLQLLYSDVNGGRAQSVADVLAGSHLQLFCKLDTLEADQAMALLHGCSLGVT